MNPRPRILYVNLKSRGRDIHEFFIGDRWHRITGPGHYTRHQLDRILRRHLADRHAAIPEGITIASR